MPNISGKAVKVPSAKVEKVKQELIKKGKQADRRCKLVPGVLLVNLPD